MHNVSFVCQNNPRVPSKLVLSDMGRRTVDFSPFFKFQPLSVTRDFITDKPAGFGSRRMMHRVWSEDSEQDDQRNNAQSQNLNDPRWDPKRRPAREKPRGKDITVHDLVCYSDKNK